MSGPKPDYPINLTEAERKKLEELVHAHKSGQTQVMRAQILLSANAHPEWGNQQIAKWARTSDRIVRKWRGRWVATQATRRRAPQWSAEAFFPLRCVRKSLQRPAVCPSCAQSPWLAGVKRPSPGISPRG